MDSELYQECLREKGYSCGGYSLFADGVNGLCGVNGVDGLSGLFVFYLTPPP